MRLHDIVHIDHFKNKYDSAIRYGTIEKSLFLRGEKVVVMDSSAILKNVQLIDELSKEYSRVIVPKIVVDELDHMKDSKKNGLAAKA